MLILDSVTTVRSGKIKLPFYHKGHLSLKSGTNVTACLIPDSATTGSARMTEMIVSPINFRSWRYLWRITATFREQAGVVHKLLSVVKEARLNVLLEESSSVENRDWHEIELIVDSSETAHSFNEEQMEESMSSFERRATAICIDELAGEVGGDRLRVRRMKALENAWRRYHKIIEDGATRPPDPSRTVVESGCLRLPGEIQSLLDDRRPLRALLVSDTKERLLRIFFPKREEQFTFLRVSHLDSIGALAEITGELARAFDIVWSLTRIQKQGDQNDFELLLYSSEFPREEDQVVRRKIISNLLAKPELASLRLRISYPRRVGSPPSRGRVPRRGKAVGFRENSGIPRVEPELLTCGTGEIARRKAETLYKKLERARFPERRQLLDSLSILRRISEQEGEAVLRTRVFVSYDFDREDLFEPLSASLEEREVEIVTGKEPNQEERFRDEVMKRIKHADCFLGVWTLKSSGLLSSWLLWELAVAQAFGKPFRLLVHREVPEPLWQRINPEMHHTLFRDLTFRDRAQVAIDSVLEDVKRSRKKLRS